MGLFDQILSNVGDSLSGGMGGMVGSLLENVGGVAGIVEKLNAAGLGDVAARWVGAGENLPINAEQIQSLLSGDTLSGLAEKLGVDPEQASGMVAQYLPGLVDSLTPDGIVPEGGADLASQGVALLKGFFK